MIDPRALLAHVGQRRLAAQVDAGQVDLLHPAPGVELGVQDRVVVRRRDPGVVERDVDAAVGLLRRREQEVDLLLVGDVALDEQAVDLAPRSRGPRSVSRSPMTTVAPSSANRRTVARPMPLHPPVTTATLPANLPVMLSSSAFSASSVSASVLSVRQSVLMKTFLTSVNASSASGPSSRPEPGLLEPAERRRVAHRRVRVDRQRAGLDAARDPQRPAHVAGPDRPGQAVLGVVGHRDRVGLVVERQHRDDRPEDLLAPDPVLRALRAARRSAGTSSRCRPARCPRKAMSTGSGDSSTYDVTVSRWPALISGPISAASSPGAITFTPLTAGSSSSRKRSKTLRCTRIRLRAQQSCPALSKTAYGAVAAACSRSASAKTMFALLPPSSRVTRITWSAAPRMMCWPTAVEPVKQTLRTAGWVTNRSPTIEPLPGITVKTPGGSPASRPSSPSRIAVSGRQLGRLQDDRVAGGQGRREPPAGDRHREVPRHDDADDAERLLERHVEAAGDRDLPAEQPLRRRRVVAQDVADVAGLPARVADGVAGVAHLELGQLLVVARRPGRRTDATAGPGRPGRPAATSRTPGRQPRSPRRSRPARPARARSRPPRSRGRSPGGSSSSPAHPHKLAVVSVVVVVQVSEQLEISEPLEAAEPLPVGHRRLEGGQLDVGRVDVVVDDVLHRTRRARSADPANRSRAARSVAGTCGLSEA